MESCSVTTIVNNARKAQRAISEYTQAALDQLTHAVAWSVMKPTRNKLLSEQACRDTGIGDVADKIQKNHRKTLGLLRDLQGVTTTGVIAEDATTGITQIARPIGVIGALVPSTNPVATPVNKIINALKCGNSIIVAPSPKGAAVCATLLGFIHDAFAQIGAPANLVQAMPTPPTKQETHKLMQLVDLVLVTGSQNNVRAAYASGTPAIGVGTGNVTIIIDASADIEAAAKKIYQSKTFDNGTSCSSENNLICHQAVYDRMLAALTAEGGYLLNAAETEKLVRCFWPGGKLNSELIARKATHIAATCSIDVPKDTSMLIAESVQIDASNLLCKERMAPILTLYKAPDFITATAMAERLLSIQGAGHSLGIHTKDIEQPLSLAHTMPTCRVVVNQGHCFATGGSFNNGMPFSLSMGCGSWGGNSIDDNLNYKHYMNISKIIRPITPREPTVEALLGQYIKKFE